MTSLSVLKQQLLDSLSQKLPDQSLCRVPDDAFFFLPVDLPENLSRNDAAAFINLTLEGSAPFPMEQLLHGYLIDAEQNRAFVFAAHKIRLRRLGIDDPESFFHLFPGFLALHGETFDQPTARFLADDANLTAVCLPAHSSVPETIHVLPLAEGPHSPGDLRAARAELLPDCKDYHPQGDIFHLERAEILPSEQPVFAFSVYPEEGEPIPHHHPLPLGNDALWAADLRGDEFARSERSARRRSRTIWQSLRAAAAVTVLLLLLQITHVSLNAFNNWRLNQIADLEPKAQLVENKLTLASRLNQSTEEDLQPFLLMEAINPLRPDTVYFDETRARSYNQLQAEGFSTEGVTEVNAFADSIRQLPYVDSIQNNVQTRNNQTSFELLITFSEMPPAPAGGFQIPEESAAEDASSEETDGPETNSGS